MTGLNTHRTLLVGMLALATACAADDDRSGDEPQDGDRATAAQPSAETAFSVATELGVRNVLSPQPGLITAGQPTEEQMEALTAAGVTRVISLRVSAERGTGWEEAHAEGAGYEFDRLPIEGAEALNRENVAALAALLAEDGEGSTLLYCGSSNRVGGLLALKAYWLDGASMEDALAVGRAGGLTQMESTVREVMERDPAE